MSVVIPLVPFIISAVLFCRSYADLFEPLQDKEPPSWVWKSSQAVLVAAVTPLVLIARPEMDGKWLGWLVGTALISIVIFVLLNVGMSRSSYFNMQRHTGLGKWEFKAVVTPARIVCFTGLAVISGCGAVAVIVGRSAA
jgi:uncharacterized integral membrane protein